MTKCVEFAEVDCFTRLSEGTRLQERAIETLESGQVLRFPKLSFSLKETEQQFLTDRAVSLRKKNVSFNIKNGKLSGTSYEGREHQAMLEMLSRYQQQATALVQSLFPSYIPGLEIGRTSYRPVEAATREKVSYRKDDRRLHVDAFPATPNQGRRLLRVFTNIHPAGLPRVWRVGDEFREVVNFFGPQLSLPFPFVNQLLYRLGITKTCRTAYDSLMLQLHNKMKADLAYQASSPQETVQLPAGSSWIVFTDQVSHAAMSGQFCLEQTFYVSKETLQYPDRSPLGVLEKYTGLLLTLSKSGKF